jgi:hypothetical protein
MMAPSPAASSYNNSMDVGFQVALSVGVPTIAVLVGILMNNSGLSDLRSHIDGKFVDQKELFDLKLQRVEEILDARLTRIEQELKIR